MGEPETPTPDHAAVAVPHEVGPAAVRAAVDAELARGADWDVHLLVRHRARADLIGQLLTPGTDDRDAVRAG